MRIDVQQLLMPDGLEAMARGIGARATALPPAELPIGQDTVYLTTADSDGVMVSFIQSNFMAFGSGIVIPGTGISLQNRGSGFVLDRQHPNCVGPSKRPFHTIIPGFVTESEAPLLSFGVMGGHMQHQGHVQMVTRIVDHGQNPQAASDAPRWFVHPDYRISLERGFAPEVAQRLVDWGHDVDLGGPQSLYGGAQLILRSSDGYVGASDHRKEGYVGGF